MTLDTSSLIKIGIGNANDWFTLTWNYVPNATWAFTFRWMPSQSYFVVTAALNSTDIIKNTAVFGGLFILPDWTLGYNFLFYDPRTITQTSDLVGYGLYYITKAEAIELGFFNS